MYLRNTADLKVITAAVLQDAESIVLKSLYTYRKLYFRNTANLSLMINAAVLKDAVIIVLQSLHTYRRLYLGNTADLSMMLTAAALKDAESIVLKSLILMNVNGDITTATGFVARFRLKINATSMIETINAAGTSTMILPAMPIKGGMQCGSGMGVGEIEHLVSTWAIRAL